MTTARLNGKKFRELTILVPWDIFVKFEAACDRDNLNRLTRNEQTLSFSEHVHASLISALKVITDKIADE